jgi:uncharacterized membrane protein YjfL (UPF0719 family)
MSGDEGVALLISLVFAYLGWKPWAANLLLLNYLSRRAATQLLAWLSPLLAGGVIFFVLIRWSSHDVRDSPLYISFYMALWLGCSGLWIFLSPYFGLNLRDDALERGNLAAALAVVGGLLGMTLIFAGANIGEGPGCWVVLFCAALGAVAMTVLWIITDACAGICDAIAIDRDVASGLRAAAFFIATGLIFGRALAGDWQSVQQTLTDFGDHGWPALVILGMLIALQFAAKPSPAQPTPNRVFFGFFPAVAFLGAAALGVMIQGPW